MKIIVRRWSRERSVSVHLLTPAFSKDRIVTYWWGAILVCASYHDPSYHVPMKAVESSTACTGRIRIGVSACLLGQRVRYDGGHKRSDFVADTLSRFIDFVPVCPEVELGLGTPRRSLRLVRDADTTRLVENPAQGSTTNGPSDLTEAMRRFARKRVATLRKENLCGYILKKDSPSCGMERVKVYSSGGMPSRNGRGLFAEELMRMLPDLPVEEEGRLVDPRLRENFIERVFAYHDLRSFFSRNWRRADLIAFHTARKFQLLAHSRVEYDRLGRMVAQASGMSRGAIEREYSCGFMAALREIATPARHKNVLDHMAGHLKRMLDDAERRELRDLIEDYRRGLVPLIVPITLLRHHVRRHDVAYLKAQTYLEPHPRELMLRNHV
jgi:uncharacterized protein YbgA (DUF1722 family)/uncharacterized protein YbbK (DUF523 family)